MSSSTLKRSISPSNDNPATPKKPRQASVATVVLEDQTNGQRLYLDGHSDPHSVTAHDIYKAAVEDLGTSNSYDMAELRIEREVGKDIIIATVRDDGREGRSTQRKEILSEMIDGQTMFLLKSNLFSSQELVIARTETLERYQKDLLDAQYIYKFEVFDTLLRALNDIIFNPRPTLEQEIHRGTEVLNEEDIGKLKQTKNYITKILDWKPASSANIALKTKALSCLTQQQQDLAKVLVTPEIYNLTRTARNLPQHLRTSQEFAKATVRQVFQDLDLGATYPGLSIAHFEDVIEHAPLPLGGGDPRPLFLKKYDDEDDNSPLKLEKKIADLKKRIKGYEAIIEECTKRIEKLAGQSLN